MSQIIENELKQRHTITPAAYQSLKILRMNCGQLEEYIQDAVLENPILELDETARDENRQSLELMREHLEWAAKNPLEEEYQPDDDREPVPDYSAEESGLREHLATQFHSALDGEELKLLAHVTEYLDDNGYLTATDAEISRSGGFDEELVGYAVAYIQMLEPLGVGAHSLGECLAIQLSMQGYDDPAIMRLVSSHLDDVAFGRYNKIAKAMGVTPKWVRGTCDIIKSLNPKPAAGFGGGSAPPVYPDLKVRIENGEPQARSVKGGYSRPYLNSYYVNLSKQDDLGDAAEYIEAKLAQARALIGAIEERRETLCSIAGFIAERQRDFFLGASDTPKPLTMRETALELGMHESTISRAVSGKYLDCKRGIFPLKYFFASAANNRGGREISRDHIKKRVRELINSEDREKPMSDSGIVGALRDEGVEVSRRVVAKYRAELNIPCTNVRKKTR